MRLTLAFFLVAAALVWAVGFGMPVAQKGVRSLTGGPWLNTPEGKPIRLEELRGKPVIVHFWTFACYNCKNNLAAYEKWRTKYEPLGVKVIGVHTPELAFERSAKNVRKAVEDLGIKFPVLIDAKGENWNRWGLR